MGAGRWHMRAFSFSCMHVNLVVFNAVPQTQQLTLAIFELRVGPICAPSQSVLLLVRLYITTHSSVTTNNQ